MESGSLTAASAPGRPVRRLGARRSRRGERAIAVALFACAAVSIATTVGIIIALAEPTVEFLADVPIGDFLTGTDWRPLFSPPDFGVIPLVTATLTVTFWALVMCLPFGLGSAIYLSEYAPSTVRRVISAPSAWATQPATAIIGREPSSRLRRPMSE